MAFTPAGTEGTISSSNSASPDTLVAAPSASTQRLIRSGTIYNADTVSATLFIAKRVSTTNYRKYKVVLSPGETWDYGSGDEVMVLDATTDSLVVWLNAAVTTNNLEFEFTYADKT